MFGQCKHAGKIQYTGLPGYVMTGCMQSPAFKSQYCKDHVERICIKGKGDSCEGTLEIIPCYMLENATMYAQMVKTQSL